MPTYFVHASAGRLSPSEKAAIARDITRIHSEATGAQPFFAQVIFAEMPSGDHFMGGAPVRADGVFVYGHIRSGRSADRKTLLLRAIVDAIAEVTKMAPRHIWGYLTDLPPRQMIEYGHLLPEPGAEDVWLEALPPGDRAYLQSLAT